LTEKFFYALTDLVALGIEGTDFFLKCFHQIALFIELSVKVGDAQFGGSAGLAFVPDETDGASDAVFERGEIGAAESEIALMIVVRIRMLDVFRDLGFQR